MALSSLHKKKLNKAISTILNEYPDIIAIYLFGSYGTEFEKENSDIDIALLPKKKINNVVLWNLAQKIACQLNRDLDLIDFSTASTVFRYQILTSGQCLYCSDEMALAQFENVAISMYLRFQEERKEIISDYRKG